MRTFGKAAIAAAVVCGLTGAGGARADAIFQYRGTVTSPDASASANNSPFRIDFDLADSVIAAGSYTLIGSGYFGGTPTFTVGQDGLIAINVAGDSVTPTAFAGRINLALSFDPSGNIVSDALTFYGLSVFANLTGPSGTVALDYPGGCAGTADTSGCTVTGAFVHVPEPMAITVFGVAILGLAATRRRV